MAPVGDAAADATADADADADSEATAASGPVTERCTALPPTAPAVVTRRSGTAFEPPADAGVSGTVRAAAWGRTAAGDPATADAPGARTARCTTPEPFPRADGTAVAGPTGTGKEATGAAPGAEPRTGEPAAAETSLETS
ncbi:hypothetical protein [Streptomyces sp. NPDC005283]|uniref:hypothetical protein n=1 Tax=Streptomyces sp. NPDC005283 TaxID=3156871 RepID=UPI003454A002